MSHLVLSNPLVRRYRFSLLRLSNLWIYLAIYASVVVLLLFLNTMSAWITDPVALGVKLYRRLYVQFLIVQIVILWIWASYNSGTVLRDEHLNKTYDFFRLLPLSALQKGFGILLGRNVLALLFAAIGFVPLVLFGVLAGLDPSIQGQIALLLLSIALFINSAILLSSTTQTRWKGQSRPGLWILLAVLAAPFFLSPLFVLFDTISRGGAGANPWVSFYNVRIPVILLVSLLALYAGLWCILGIVRKFRLEDEPLFSRVAALFFLCGYEIIAIGLFPLHTRDFAQVAYPFWLMISLAPVVCIPLGAIRTFNGYLESLRSSRSMLRSSPAALLAHSNIALGIGLFIVWAAFSTLVAVVSQTSLSRFALDAVTLFSFYCVLLLLLEMHVVYVPVYTNIGLLLGFLALTYLVLPLILSPVLNIEKMYVHSFFGFFGYLVSLRDSVDTRVNTVVSAVNGALCIVPALLVARRYVHILSLKRTIDRTAPQA